MPSDHPFKWRQFEPELILLCVRWYLRYAVSYRDLEEMMRERGLSVDHTTIYRWVQRYAPEIAVLEDVDLPVAVQIESMPNLGSAAGEATTLRRTLALEPGGDVVFATGNPKVYHEYRDAGIRCVGLDNRPNGISGKLVRQHLIEDRINDLSQLIRPRVLSILINEGLVDRLRSIDDDAITGVSPLALVAHI